MNPTRDSKVGETGEHLRHTEITAAVLAESTGCGSLFPTSSICQPSHSRRMARGSTALMGGSLTIHDVIRQTLVQARRSHRLFDVRLKICSSPSRDVEEAVSRPSWLDLQLFWSEVDWIGHGAVPRTRAVDSLPINRSGLTRKREHYESHRFIHDCVTWNRNSVKGLSAVRRCRFGAFHLQSIRLWKWMKRKKYPR